MDLVYKGDFFRFLLGTTAPARYVGLETLRFTVPGESFTIGELEDDQPIAVAAGTEGRAITPDFADTYALPAVPGPVGGAVLIGFQDSDDVSDGISAVYHAFIAGGPELPRLEEGIGFRTLVDPLGYTPLSFDPDTNQVIRAGPYADGAELDWGEIDAFEFLGRIGDALLPGEDAARKARVETIARLYEAGLDRDGEIDEGGLNFWIDAAGRGLSNADIAGAFLESPEFTAAFGRVDGLSDGELVERLYQNVLDRDGEAEGVAFWTGALAEGFSRENLLLAFADSSENREASAFVEELAETDPGIWEFPA